MNIKDLLNPSCTSAQSDVSSTKTILDKLAHLLGEQCPSVGSDKILEELVARERLGSTAIGHGVAMPHAKLSSITSPMLAIVTTQNGIDFDAPDDELVDIFFGLILPDEDKGEHLQSLKCITELARQEEVRKSLRAAADQQSLVDVAITQSED